MDRAADATSRYRDATKNGPVPRHRRRESVAHATRRRVDAGRSVRAGRDCRRRTSVPASRAAHVLPRPGCRPGDCRGCGPAPPVGGHAEWCVRRRGRGGGAGATRHRIRERPPALRDREQPSALRLSAAKAPTWRRRAHLSALAHRGALLWRAVRAQGREWRTSVCDRNDTRAFVRDVDQYRGARRLWLVSGGSRPYRSARVAVRDYLATIGVRRDSLFLPSLNRDGVWLDLYDLGDTVRLRSADAETFPVPPMPRDPRPGCRPWVKPSPIDSLRLAPMTGVEVPVDDGYVRRGPYGR